MAGWKGRRAGFVTERRFNYGDAKAFWEEHYNKKYDEANFSTVNPSRSNYAIEQLGTSYALRMYRTHIITWDQDSSATFVRYDSNITYSTQRTFGGLKFWRDSRSPFECKTRFGDWHGKHYPFHHILTINKDGWTTTELHDQKYRIIPALKKERMEIRRKFREVATSRLLLGEFGNLVAEKETNGAWVAHVPVSNTSVAQLFLKSADHADIVREFAHTRTMSKRFGRRDVYYPSYELAALAVLRALLNQYLSGPEWTEKYRIDYPPVNVRGL